MTVTCGKCGASCTHPMEEYWECPNEACWGDEE